MQYVQDSRIKGGREEEGERALGWLAWLAWRPLELPEGPREEERGADDVMWRMGVEKQGFTIKGWRAPLQS